MIKTPKFWLKKNLISYALLPFGFLYLLGAFVNNFFTKTYRISKPVICVGNLIAGGSGKTPTAIALGKILKEIEPNFAYLSRGYMSDGSQFLLLQKEDNRKAQEVGDEPMLLVEAAPTFVSRNRAFGAKMLDENYGVNLVVLDDGMQNNSLFRDYTILVIDAKIAFGNEFPIPAGPMRERLESGLKKVDLVVVIGELNDYLRQKLVGKKIVTSHIFPKNLSAFQGKKLLAFCGLAYPQKFFDLLTKSGLNVVATKSFGDHHKYKISHLEEICQVAESLGAQPIATKKDWVKFPRNFQEKIAHLDIELRFDDETLLRSELKKLLKC
jgi:tetraacyldisaccharide 4'-kinase